MSMPVAALRSFPFSIRNGRVLAGDWRTMSPPRSPYETRGNLLLYPRVNPHHRLPDRLSAGRSSLPSGSRQSRRPAPPARGGCANVRCRSAGELAMASMFAVPISERAIGKPCAYERIISIAFNALDSFLDFTAMRAHLCAAAGAAACQHRQSGRHLRSRRDKWPVTASTYLRSAWRGIRPGPPAPPATN